MGKHGAVSLGSHNLILDPLEWGRVSNDYRVSRLAAQPSFFKNESHPPPSRSMISNAARTRASGKKKRSCLSKFSSSETRWPPSPMSSSESSNVVDLFEEVFSSFGAGGDAGTGGARTLCRSFKISGECIRSDSTGVKVGESFPFHREEFAHG